MTKKLESDLIQELFRTVETMGVDETTTALKVARCNSNITLKDNRLDFVLKMCASHYLQTVDDLIYSHSKSIKRMTALRFAVYYLYTDFGFTFSELKMCFKRDKSMLSKSVKTIKEESEKNPTIKKIKNKFDILVSDFKILNKIK